MDNKERGEILTRKLFEEMLELSHLIIAVADDCNIPRWRFVLKLIWVQLKMELDMARKLLPQEIALVDANELEKQMEDLRK